MARKTSSNMDLESRMGLFASTDNSAEADQRNLAGRVEDWRGVPKVQPSRCSPFPLGVPH